MSSVCYLPKTFFKHVFDRFLKYLCFLIFITGGLINLVSTALQDCKSVQILQNAFSLH